MQIERRIPDFQKKMGSELMPGPIVCDILSCASDSDRKFLVIAGLVGRSTRPLDVARLELGLSGL